MVWFEIPLLCSSDVNAGAINKTSDGSQYEITTDEPIIIPEESTNCELFATSASVWNVVPNVVTGVNDMWYIEIATVNYVVTIPEGLYDLNTLEETIDNDLISQGAVGGSFSFLPNDPTQQVVIRINIAGVQINLLDDTPRDLLGFDNQLLPPGGVSAGVEFFLGDEEASFNNIDFFLIHTDLCSEGIRLNGTFNQSIAKVDIGATPPGSLITNQYFVPVKCECTYLIGSIRKTWKIWLTDQANERVNTEGENFVVQLVLRYRLPDIN